MGVLSDLEKINKKTFSIVIINILLLTTPGIAVLFIFYRPLFLNVDFPKLLALSLAITSPLVVINFFLGLKETDTMSQMTEDETYRNLTFAIIISALVLYLSTATKLVLNALGMYSGLFILTIIFELMTILIELRDRTKKKSKISKK